MSQGKQPPPGVETTPEGRVVLLREAAARLNKDPRTVIAAIKKGTVRGGAMPRRERLRWYVYVDELPHLPTDDEVSNLRAQLVTQTEVNRSLLAAQANLLEGDDLQAAAAEKYRAAAGHYRDALAQLMTPGHVGDLDADV